MAIALVAGIAAFILLGRDDKAEAVRSCIEKAGATVEESPNAKQIFPYLLAIGAGTSVQSMPELDDASVYGVRYGDGEALLFFARDGEDAGSLEQTLVGFGAGGGVDVPSSRAGKVLLVWTVPVSGAASSPLDACIE